jgi:hypothetical protein
MLRLFAEEVDEVRYHLPNHLNKKRMGDSAQVFAREEAFTVGNKNNR